MTTTILVVSDCTIDRWIEIARRDDWHMRFVGSDIRTILSEIKRLRLENWQLKGALGYPVPGDIPEGKFKCGLCEARALSGGMGGTAT